MVITQIPPIWLEYEMIIFLRSIFFSLGLIEIIVFVVIQHFQHSLENIIVVDVEKHFVLHVCNLLFSYFKFNKFLLIGSSKQSSLHEYGIDVEVRVCELCYDRLKT